MHGTVSEALKALRKYIVNNSILLLGILIHYWKNDGDFWGSLNIQIVLHIIITAMYFDL